MEKYNKENPVRATTLEIIKSAKDVKINRQRAEELAKEWVSSNLVVPAWPKDSHLNTNDQEKVTDYIILLTAVNFCFWQVKGKKWCFNYKGKEYNGYFGMSFALKNFFENNPDKGLSYFSKISFEDFKTILQGGKNLLLLKERWQIVRKVSTKIIKKYGSSIGFIQSADKKSSVLVEKIYKELFSFDDISKYDGKKVYLLKRPQILVADLWGSLDGKGIAEFDDLEYLTCFPDYKVPQALNYFGITEYSSELKKKIENRIIIPHNSKQEIEIRAATVWGVEYLRNALEKGGKKVKSFEVDWILWNKAQNEKIEINYHLTPTVYY